MAYFSVFCGMSPSQNHPSKRDRHVAQQKTPIGTSTTYGRPSVDFLHLEYRTTSIEEQGEIINRFHPLV